MQILVVSLDQRHPIQAYQPLYDELKSRGFQRLQPHLWAGACDATPAAVKAAVLRRLRPEDGVFVFSQTELDDYASHNPLRSPAYRGDCGLDRALTSERAASVRSWKMGGARSRVAFGPRDPWRAMNP